MKTVTIYWTSSHYRKRQRYSCRVLVGKVMKRLLGRQRSRGEYSIMIFLGHWATASYRVQQFVALGAETSGSILTGNYVQ